MRRTSTVVACFVFVLSVLGAGSSDATVPATLRARAEIKGAPDSKVAGTVTFTQTGTGVLPTVRIVARVTGLEPNTVHGFHIHEKGACEPNFGAAGGHFDPGPKGDSHPDNNHPFHMGDIPNLRANARGVAVLEHVTSRITLSEGPLSIFDEDGSAVIVHEHEDKGTTGVAGGAGGGRIGCGVIERVK